MRDTEEATDYDVRAAVAKILHIPVDDDRRQGIIINDDGSWIIPDPDSQNGRVGHWAVDGVNQDDGLPNISILLHPDNGYQLWDDCCEENEPQPYLDLMLVVKDDETQGGVARELIGPRSSVSYRLLPKQAGDQWPSVRFYGSTMQLAAIQAKSVGSPVVRPGKKEQ